MSQLQDQVISPVGGQFMGALNQGINIMNPPQFGQIPQTQPQNMGLGIGAVDPKNTESNFFIIFILFFIIIYRKTSTFKA